MAKLVLSAGGAIVHQCFVDSERVTIGREPGNRIVIDDPAVSREHAAIVQIGNDHILEDLASANGTYVNGTRVPRRILQHGDVMAFGQHHLRYLNPRASQETDLDRTMLIAGLADRLAARPPVQGGAPAPMSLPSARVATRNFPKGRVNVVAGERAGESIVLDRVVAVFGRPGKALAVITRRPHGYFVAHVEGRRLPRVNGRPLAKEPRLLKHGDVVEVADQRLEFVLE